MNEEDIDIHKIADLCRIRLKDEKKLKTNLTQILKYVALLNEVNTDDVNPCNHVLEVMGSSMREDEVKGTMPREAFLSNAPSQVGGMIKTPPVIQFEE